MEHLRRNFLCGMGGALASAGTFAARPGSASVRQGSEVSAQAEDECCTFIQAGLGAVERTMQGKARDIISPEDFGAVGDGETDDTNALQVTLDRGGAIQLRSGATYKITDTVHFTTDDTHLVGHGASIVLDTTRAVHALHAADLDGLVVQGVEVDGRRSIKNDGSNGLGIGIRFQVCRRSAIVHCYVHDCYEHGISISGAGGFGCEDIVVQGNRCIDNGHVSEGRGTGIWVYNKPLRFVINGNLCSNNVAGGIFVDDTSSGETPGLSPEYFAITGNTVFGAYEPNSVSGGIGIGVAGARQFSISGNHIHGYGNALTVNSAQSPEPAGLGAITGNYAAGRNRSLRIYRANSGLVVTGNLFELLDYDTNGATNQAVEITNGTGGSSMSAGDILISGNQVRSPGNGVSIGEVTTGHQVTGMVIEGNQFIFAGGARRSGDAAIKHNNVNGLIVRNNTITGFRNGIIGGVNSAGAIIACNVILNCVWHGINSSDATAVILSNLTRGNGNAGVNFGGGMNISTVIVKDNQFLDNTPASGAHANITKRNNIGLV